MASLPFDKITEAVFDRLETELGDPVIHAGGDVPGAKYVAIDTPTSDANRTKTSRGRDNVLVARCHIHGGNGEVEFLEAKRLASQVDAALQQAPLDLGSDHEFLDLAPPNHSQNQYNPDPGTQALDVILRYTLKTHDLTS